MPLDCTLLITPNISTNNIKSGPTYFTINANTLPNFPSSKPSSVNALYVVIGLILCLKVFDVSINQPIAIQENNAPTGISTVLVISSKKVNKSKPNKVIAPSNAPPTDHAIGIEIKKHAQHKISVAFLL